VGKNLAISLQEFITLSFLYRKRTIKRILFAFIFQTSALPVQSRLVFISSRTKLSRSIDKRFEFKRRTHFVLSGKRTRLGRELGTRLTLYLIINDYLF
ncbi:MAG TPA: hypothetical protein VNI84_09435, partial [Pyrinomonadaceae bacterium]|nr:hypothetical protein [Pyrinomonadaceae bacterium]